MIVFYITIGIIALVGLVWGLYSIFHPSATTVKAIYDNSNEKDIGDMTYEEFSLYIMDYDLEPMIAYDDFEIYHIGDKYYYYECIPESDSDEFYEVEEVAILEYSFTNDLLVKDGAILSTLFECDVCGESTTDDRIYYGWYKKVGGC